MKAQTLKSELNPIDQKIVDLWQKNVTALNIANLLGLTKNSVIGRVNRLRTKGHDLRKKELPAKGKAMKRRKPVSKPVILKAMKRRKPVSKPVILRWTGPSKKIAELKTYDCRYVISDRSDELFLFCGKPKVFNSYCAEHHALCHARPANRVKGPSLSAGGLADKPPYNFM